jgi:hypothetical protein
VVIKMPKQLTRNQTSNFLQNSQGTSSFRLFPEKAYNLGNPSLTGAGEPIIPMRIMTMGKNQQPIDVTLLMNPETWNHAKTDSYQVSYTRTGWVPQLWGPNQDTLSTTGKTAAWMNPDIGLDNFNKQSTFAYLNFISLLSAYRTNGCEFLDRLSVDKLTRVINVVSGVHIMYDNQEFIGHFSNFTLDEDDEHPFIYNYNFEFIISALDGDETEIRGHYKKLAVSKEINTPPILVGDAFK